MVVCFETQLCGYKDGGYDTIQASIFTFFTFSFYLCLIQLDVVQFQIIPFLFQMQLLKLLIILVNIKMKA